VYCSVLFFIMFMYNVTVTYMYLQLLIEFDDDVESSDECDWLPVYSAKLHHLFLVEDALVLAQRSAASSPGAEGNAGQGTLFPALSFRPLADRVRLWKASGNKKLPVEFLVDLKLDFQDVGRLRAMREWDAKVAGLHTGEKTWLSFKAWRIIQETQAIFCDVPDSTVGAQVKAFRPEGGSVHWHNGMASSYNQQTGVSGSTLQSRRVFLQSSLALSK